MRLKDFNHAILSVLVANSCALLANFCALLANRCAMLDKSRALLANSCALLNKSCVLLANPCAPFVYIHCLYLVHITRVKVYAMSSTGFKWTQDKLLIAKNMIVTGKKNQEIMDSIGCKIRSIQKFRATRAREQLAFSKQPFFENSENIRRQAYN